MASSFQSGTRPLSVGDLEVVVSGLALGFTPGSVVTSVRTPSDGAALLNSYVVGTPTSDGFSVSLSSPVPSSGYLLDYTVFGDGSISPTDPTTLAVGYVDLKNTVATFLGYDAASLTTSQANEVDSYIQAGVRNFYYPPKMSGVDEHFEWSFIRQNGTVNTSSGVDAYTLPNGIGRIAGQVAVLGTDGFMLPVIPYGDIVAMRTRPRTERPRFVAVTSSTEFGSKGQRKTLHVYPTPDKAYALSFVCDADTGKLNATDHVYPLGGPMFSELVTESCLAVAEQRANDAVGIHTQMFNEQLVSMIARDRKASAQSFGDIGDPEARTSCYFRPLATRGFLY